MANCIHILLPFNGLQWLFVRRNGNFHITWSLYDPRQNEQFFNSVYIVFEDK